MRIRRSKRSAKQSACIGEDPEGGPMLRSNRHSIEMTQKELANAIGISQHHISEMENGKRPIGKAMAKRLADVFKVNYRIFL
jgi:transcriptional regulator with XRE-family HTH domain